MRIDARPWLVGLAVLLGGCSSPTAGDDAGLAPVAAPLCWSEVRATPDGESASEVSIAVNPLDPAHLVAAANSGGDFAVYTSLDGGATWTAERVDGLSLGAAFATTQSLSDPALAFWPDGTLLMAGLAYIPTSQVFVAARPTPTSAWQADTVWQSEVAATMND